MAGQLNRGVSLSIVVFAGDDVNRFVFHDSRALLQRPHPKAPVVNSFTKRDTEGGEARPRRSNATRRPERTAEPGAARPLSKTHRKIPTPRSGLANYNPKKQQRDSQTLPHGLHLPGGHVQPAEQRRHAPYKRQLRMRRREPSGASPPGGSISRLSGDVYGEAAHLAYYFHWSRIEVMGMSRRERRIWRGQSGRIPAPGNNRSKVRALREAVLITERVFYNHGNWTCQDV